MRGLRFSMSREVGGPSRDDPRDTECRIMRGSTELALGQGSTPRSAASAAVQELERLATNARAQYTRAIAEGLL